MLSHFANITDVEAWKTCSSSSYSSLLSYEAKKNETLMKTKHWKSKRTIITRKDKRIKNRCCCCCYSQLNRLMLLFCFAKKKGREKSGNKRTRKTKNKRVRNKPRINVICLLFFFACFSVIIIIVGIITSSTHRKKANLFIHIRLSVLFVSSKRTKLHFKP